MTFYKIIFIVMEYLKYTYRFSLKNFLIIFKYANIDYITLINYNSLIIHILKIRLKKTFKKNIKLG